jgi:hypothetical protein
MLQILARNLDGTPTLLRNGECCDDKMYPDLGMTAELAAWWQHNNALGGEVISVGAITALAIPVDHVSGPQQAFPGLVRPRGLGRSRGAARRPALGAGAQALGHQAGRGRTGP